MVEIRSKRCKNSGIISASACCTGVTKKARREVCEPESDQKNKVVKVTDSAKAYRERVRKQLEEAFSGVASEADEGIRLDVEACDPVQVAASVESAMFEKIGWSNGVSEAKYQSVLFNLKDTQNLDLRRKVLLGQIVPEVLVSMTAEEMASQKRERENVQIRLKTMKRCMHETDEKEKASTDMFKCGRSGERKCSYYQLQARSADEPMTTYVTCVNCNNHWKL
ncbi:transcription elongation factor TFIIS-like [Carya illinoinensis]|uniref:transcription elongation factor TFIIS-like n=1 Tax=Carya illinoinensis TaxID=32201 RepID=UPI001C717C63|nr:transcription elongation factor TFIIS-like [Carya illinoinensis]